MIELFLGIVILFVMGVRLTSIFVMALLFALYLAYPLYNRRSWLIAGCIAYFASLILPVDVAAEGVLGNHHGHGGHGPRLVHCVGTCMPRHSYLLNKYGEYFTHSSAGGLFGPRWIFVWD